MNGHLKLDLERSNLWSVGIILFETITLMAERSLISILLEASSGVWISDMMFK